MRQKISDSCYIIKKEENAIFDTFIYEHSFPKGIEYSYFLDFKTINRTINSASDYGRKNGYFDSLDACKKAIKEKLNAIAKTLQF